MIKKIHQLDEVDQFHAINNIICIFDNVDNAIHYNTINELLNEFLSGEDLEQGLKQSLNYNFNHKYFIHQEYKKLQSSNNLFDLIDPKQLELIMEENKDEIKRMELI